MRYQQPQSGQSELANISPLTRGLMFAYSGSFRRSEAASGDQASALGSGASVVAAPFGQALRFTGGQANGAASWGSAYNKLAGATSFTVAILANLSSVASGKLLAKWGAASGNILLVEFSSSGNIGVIVGDPSANRNSAATSGSPVSANSLVRIIWTWDASRSQGSGNGHTIRINGVNRSVSNHADSNPSSVTAVGSNTTSAWQIGVANDGTPVSGDVYAVDVWRNVVLSDSEQIALDQNYWQIYGEDEEPPYLQASGTITPSGQTAAFTTGNLSPSLTLPVSGQSAAFTNGNVSPVLSLAATGQTSAFSTGAVTASLALGLSGQSAAFTAGTVAPTITVALSGQSAAFTAGTVTPTAPGVIVLPGQTANFSVGALTAAIDLAIGGQSSAFSVGTVSALVSLGVTGQSAAFSAGQVTPSITVALSGQSAAFSVGTPQPTGGNITVALSGNTASFSAGDLGVPSGAAGGYGGGKPAKKKFFIEKDGKVLVFSTANAAVNAIPDLPEVPTPKQVKKVQAQVIEALKDETPVEEIAVKEVKQLADPRMDAMLQQRNYEALLDLYRRIVIQRDEEDIEELLLTL